MTDLDHKDRILLAALQEDARLTINELAERVDLSSSGVQKRLRKLEDSGVIEQYVTLISRSKVGLGLLCFVEVSLATHVRQDVADFDAAINRFAEVLECHRLTGGADYLLKIIVRDREHLDCFLMDVLMPLPAVDKLKTSVVLREIKETTSIPIQRPPD